MLTRLTLTGLLAVLAASGPASALQPPAADTGVEVLARGPVHEAFAATAELPVAGPVVPKLPPQPVDELPPDQKPAGDNVIWIPGYWSWDEERSDFIWVSGFWRVPPPGRVWVPGSWREVQGGWQWIQGFWQAAMPVAADQPAVAADIQYLPPPPEPLEVAPSVPAPTVTSFYVPGTWVWRQRYVWRPGFWIEHRPNWVWCPAHYRYTPAGYVFVDGYWDHPLETRGVLFAPVAFSPAVVARPAFVYTPAYCVPPASLYTSLFVRRGWGGYYFGDYFEPRYSNIGFSAWIGGRNSSFALSVNVGGGRPAPLYDPLWAYYQVAHRHDPVWVSSVTNVYAGRYRGDVPRPPRTLIQQNVVVNNITNNNTVINNTVINNNNTVINRPAANPAAADLTMVAPIASLPQTNPAVTLRPVQRDERVREQQVARQLREVGANRQKLETGLATRSLTPTQPTDRPRQVKLDVPPAVVARAQVPTAVDKAPPPPAAQLAEVANRRPPMKPGIPTPPPVVRPVTQTAKPQPAIPPTVVPSVNPTVPTPPTMPADKPVTPAPTVVPPVKPASQPAIPTTPANKPPVTVPTVPPVKPTPPVRSEPKKPSGPMPPQMGLPTLPPPSTPGRVVPQTTPKPAAPAPQPPAPVKPAPAPVSKPPAPTLPPARPATPTLPPAAPKPTVPPATKPAAPPKLPPARTAPPPVKPPEKQADDKKK
jgi:hypothetical protein